MSIRPTTILAGLLREQRLFVRPSSYTGFETARTVYVVPEIFAITRPPFGETVRDQRLAEFANSLDAFSEGGRISVANDPRRKPPDSMLARVDPVEAGLWSLRVTEPEQTDGIRALGAFVEKNEFVVLSWHFREEMVDFDQDVADAHEIWIDLFDYTTPHRGHTLNEYLTNFWEV